MAEYGYTDIDVQYSPRFWVPRMAENVVVDTHIRITTEDAPIFVYIHGGYWQHLSKEISCYPTLPLFKAGIRVFIVGYDLAPTVKMETIVEEIGRAATFILRMAEELGSSGVWFSGFSAGGHLTGTLLSSSWMNSLPPSQAKLIRGYLPISGIFDLKPITKTYINGPLQMDEIDAERYSPMNMEVSNNQNITAIIIFGQHDSPEFQRQSKEFTQKLQNCHINAMWYEVPGMDHFNLVEELSKSEYLLTKMIIETIKSKIDKSTKI